MIRDTPRFRGFWEIECCVPGCPHLLLLSGGWQDHPLTPPTWDKTATERGWFYQNNRYIVYPEVPGNEGYYCPEHAKLYTNFIAKAKEWDERRRKHRKTWWLKYFCRYFNQHDPPIPTNPFAKQTQHRK